MRGYSLIEVMFALVLLTFGLLSAGQMLFITASSSSLARSKSTAAIAAQEMLESLAALYQRDSLAPDLAPGSHDPVQIEIANPVDASTLNRFRIEWNISPVPDPRPGKTLNAILLAVTVTPSLSQGTSNNKPGLNKILNVTTILTPDAR